ncbi:hypothetical protein CRV01_12195 [Arcobacter sp. CECT 8983]|uniref:helix-turn-helix domain-containing protein n=1 Tax=Arcobacter sp. CECT 8983 TaxID=2044508 RepID=UPI00100BA789|nr:AraC family transcriptional regulator [Arcobacter sp. CECT 8983]RXJ88502.1 hypothetical protein CRV01_12195 [Arcobacter sp. CECT 8983]
MSLNKINFKFNNNQSEMIFPSEKVEGEIIDKQINDSIYFVKSNIVLKDDIVVLSKSKVDGIMMDFNLVGDVNYKSKVSKYGFSTSNNMTDIELVKEEETESKAKKGNINKITLVLKKDFLSKVLPENKETNKVFDSLQKNYCHELLASKTTDFQVGKILSELYYTSLYKGKLGEIYLESKILELIYLELNSLFNPKESLSSSIKFDEKDMQALEKAKNIINSLTFDCTISSLSKKVALNEFKLKYGFKKFFNTSPGALVLQTRMEEAKKLLESSDYNISEISRKVGYKYQQSFSTAFFKHFGVLPKDVMKTRKYYY